MQIIFWKRQWQQQSTAKKERLKEYNSIRKKIRLKYYISVLFFCWFAVVAVVITPASRLYKNIGGLFNAIVFIYQLI